MDYESYTDDELAELDELDESIQRFLNESRHYVRKAPMRKRYKLTARDVRQLTLYKWRYSLESAGYTTHQAEHLLFLKWLHARHGPLG